MPLFEVLGELEFPFTISFLFFSRRERVSSTTGTGLRLSLSFSLIHFAPFPLVSSRALSLDTHIRFVNKKRKDLKTKQTTHN